MNEALIYALSKRIEAEQMTVEQVPVPLQEAVQENVGGNE